jgi:hypothetical protein
MKERIQELAEQAGLISPQDDRENWQEYINDVEKFAELIVQECMRMCDVAAVGYDTHNHIKEANGCCSAKEYIAEHFGVEE